MRRRLSLALPAQLLLAQLLLAPLLLAPLLLAPLLLAPLLLAPLLLAQLLLAPTAMACEAGRLARAQAQETRLTTLGGRMLEDALTLRFGEARGRIAIFGDWAYGWVESYAISYRLLGEAMMGTRDAWRERGALPRPEQLAARMIRPIQEAFRQRVTEPAFGGGVLAADMDRLSAALAAEWPAAPGPGVALRAALPADPSGELAGGADAQTILLRSTRPMAARLGTLALRASEAGSLVGGGADEAEDYSVPKYLKAEQLNDIGQAVPALGQELRRYMGAASLHLAAARGDKEVPANLEEHHAALDQLGRDTRSYAARLFLPDAGPAQKDLVASLIEEADFAGAVEEQLWQIGRRVKRESFSTEGRALVDEMLGHVSASLAPLLTEGGQSAQRSTPRDEILLDLRARCLGLDGAVQQAERGALLALLGSAERVLLLIARLGAERRSVPRVVPQAAAEAAPSSGFGGAVPQPAE